MEMGPLLGTKMSYQGGKEVKPGNRMLLTPTQMSRWFQCQPYEGSTCHRHNGVKNFIL